MPSTEVRCDKTSFGEYSNAKLKEMLEVECDVCEVVNIVTVWNSEGLLEGTLYEYSLGSEPALWLQKECEYFK